MATPEILRNVYLFKEIPPHELAPIQAVCRLKTFNPGDVVFRQSDSASALYIIKYGSVRILQTSNTEEPVEVSVLGPGSHFGEMPLVDDGKRSATVESCEKTELYEIPYDALKSVLVKHPQVAVLFYKSLAHFLAGRLRVTTTDLSFAREMNLRHF